MTEERETRQRERQGMVVSDKMDKTIVVEVASVKPHPRYEKVVRRTSRLKAHDEATMRTWATRCWCASAVRSPRTSAGA